MFTQEEEDAIRAGLPMFLKFKDLQAMQVKLADLETAKAEEKSKLQDDINAKHDPAITETQNNVLKIQSELSDLLK